MEKQDILKVLEDLRKQSKKRNFTQTFEVIVNLKNLNLKKPEENVNKYVVLPYSKGKKVRIAAFVDKELVAEAKKLCNHVVLKDEFDKYDKKAIKKIASETDFFISQASVMPKVASSFGKIIGSMGKMPNPKAGCVLPPNAELKPVIEKLDKTVKLETKNELIVKAGIGTESMNDNEIAENLLSFYNNLLSSLPNEKENVKNILLKLTMASPVRIGV